MATSSMDKGLYAAPMGMEQEMDAPIEIEIENPDSVDIGIGGFQLHIEPDNADEFDANLAELMDDSDLKGLSSELIDDFDKDTRDRRDWIQTYVEGLKLLGLRYEERTEPWQGACGVFHPMLTESVVRFQSEGITETFPAMGPVKTKIIGKETPETEEAAARVQEDMNYQLTEVMTEYRPEHEKLLWSLPITGSAFKKVYYDPSKGRQMAVFIPAEDLVVPYGARDIESSERVTHVMRKTKNEVLKLQESGFYLDTDLGDPSYELDDVEKQKSEENGMSAIQDDRYRILEMHVDIDLPGFEHENKKGEKTGIALPYVITVEKQSGEILSIRRNWYDGDPLHIKRQHFVHYQYIPGDGFYGYGLIHLIGGYAKSATMLIRQLVDAGTLSNLPGGLKSRGLRIKGDDTPIQPGEFRDVDVPSGSIRDNILPLPYKEPSQVLFALFQNIVEEGRSFANGGDMNVSDMSAQAPVGTTLAILERTLKVMGAVQSRMHFSMKQEFKLLKVIIADYAPEDYDYEPEDGSRAARKSDYDSTDVIPVSDPNASTMAQKIVQYQAVLQLAQGAPQLYDMPLLHRQMIEVLGVKNANKLVKTEDDQVPTDPVQENQNVMTGQPVKAFVQQNHEAHIQVHMMAMQDPKIVQIISQSPQAQMIQAAMLAHINEHVGFQYRMEIEKRMGISIPVEDQNKQIPPEMANHIAIMAADAAKQLFTQNTQEAKQQQAQQQMQDPIVQMQMQELQIKQGELQLKQQKQQIDAAAKADQIRVEESRIAVQKEIAVMQVAANSAAKLDQMNKKAESDGARLGVDIQKHRAQMAMQNAQKTAQQLPNKPKKG
jgi:hypothetical protein